MRKVKLFNALLCTILLATGVVVATGVNKESTVLNADGEIYELANTLVDGGKYLITTTTTSSSSLYVLPTASSTNKCPSIIETENIQEISNENVWTVTLSLDGKYSFTTSTGLYLSSGSGTDSIRVNSTIDYWTLTAEANGFSMVENNNGRNLGIATTSTKDSTLIWRSYGSSTYSAYSGSGIRINFYRLVSDKQSYDDQLLSSNLNGTYTSVSMSYKYKEYTCPTTSVEYEEVSNATNVHPGDSIVIVSEVTTNESTKKYVMSHTGAGVEFTNINAIDNSNEWTLEGTGEDNKYRLLNSDEGKYLYSYSANTTLYFNKTVSECSVFTIDSLKGNFMLYNVATLVGNTKRVLKIDPSTISFKGFADSHNSSSIVTKLYVKHHGHNYYNNVSVKLRLGVSQSVLSVGTGVGFSNENNAKYGLCVTVDGKSVFYEITNESNSINGKNIHNEDISIYYITIDFGDIINFSARQSKKIYLAGAVQCEVGGNTITYRSNNVRGFTIKSLSQDYVTLGQSQVQEFVDLFN